MGDGDPGSGSGPPHVVRLLWRWAWLGAVLVGGLVGVVTAASIHMPQVDTLSGYTPGLVTHLYDVNGETIVTYKRENRILLEESEIPDLLRDAIVAVEDERFYRHGGVDLQGILRATYENLVAGEIVEGASTLTMQLAENLYHTRGRDWRRKISETLLAVEIEKRYSKQQILTLYCNVVYMGAGQYGMEAAARHYFGKSVDELSLAETATLAGIPRAPSVYNPRKNPGRTAERRNHVLGRMLAVGVIDRATYQRAVSQPLQVTDRPPTRSRSGSYFAEEVRRRLEERYGDERLYEGGLQVQTTLDPRMQRAAEETIRERLLHLDHRRGWRGPIRQLEEIAPAEAELPSWGDEVVPGPWYRGVVLSADASSAEIAIGEERFTLGRDGIAWTREHRVSKLLEAGDVAWFRLEASEEERRLVLEQEPELEGVAIVLESTTGAVRAMVGGWSFERSQFNRATQARRQVGSAFKPFVYGAALESGFTPADTVFDAPTAFRGADGPESYRPRNYTRRHHGIITLRRALEQSVNVPAVKLLDMVGVERVIDFARRCGIDGDLPRYPSIALGSADLAPLELAHAYATIANQGLSVEPYLVDEVATSGGRALEGHTVQARMATDAAVAFVLTRMLEGVVDRGTGAAIRSLPIAVAGKTGTTNDYTDAWFVGYTPTYTILTWVGYDKKRSLGRGMTGAEVALPIWRKIAERGLEEGWLERGAEFAVPPGVELLPVSHRTGRLASGSGPGVIEEAFVAGTQPQRPSAGYDPEVMSLPIYQQRQFYIPKEGEKSPVGQSFDGEGEPG